MNWNPTHYISAPAETPVKHWPRDNSSIGATDLATTTKQWCALLDIIDKRPDFGGRDAMATCVPVESLTPDTLTITTETLDYVGAVSMSVAVVGNDIMSLRVTVEGSGKTFGVQRTESGPGAVAFVNPTYGEQSVTYEGLDATGRVVATSHSD